MVCLPTFRGCCERLEILAMVVAVALFCTQKGGHRTGSTRDAGTAATGDYWAGGKTEKQKQPTNGR